MTAQKPRALYLHGFASGPGSTKAQRFEKAAREASVGLEVLDLRRPSFEHLRLSAMVEHVGNAIGDARGRAILVGSSLGGLTACRLAERDARVGALLLLAPAFSLVERWKTMLGPEKMEDWRKTGWLEVDDYAEKKKARVDYGFFEDLLVSDPSELPDVRVPTVIVHGVRDEVVPVEHSRRFASGKRHVKLLEVDDGHELVASVGLALAEAATLFAPWGWGAGAAEQG
jgi:pimeloyl-ACP methyl ester carboxylesterase